MKRNRISRARTMHLNFSTRLIGIKWIALFLIYINLSFQTYNLQTESPTKTGRDCLQRGVLAISLRLQRVTSCNKMSDKIQNFIKAPGFCKVLEAVRKLTEEAGVSDNVARLWLRKQAIWQLYLPVPKNITRQKFDVTSSNSVQQADLLFFLHDRLSWGRKDYKYALTEVRSPPPGACN